MANALTDFTKKREFLICMDSDGCVMDTVRIKHSTVMCPELIRVFALDDHADFITAAWDEINLHTITRGISRFESVRLVFDRLKNRGIEIPGSEDIAAWVDTATELSTASLQRELQKTGSLALRKLQEWNNACNRRIQALEPTFEPFPGVRKACASCTPWPMWPSSVPRTRAPLPASGSATGWPVMRMSSSGRRSAARQTPSPQCWPAGMRAARS